MDSELLKKVKAIKALQVRPGDRLVIELEPGAEIVAEDVPRIVDMVRDSLQIDNPVLVLARASAKVARPKEHPAGG